MPSFHLDNGGGNGAAATQAVPSQALRSSDESSSVEQSMGCASVPLCHFGLHRTSGVFSLFVDELHVFIKVVRMFV